MKKIELASYLNYKFFNSIFGGLSVGAIFTIYSPIKPSIFQIGGIFLALGLLGVAYFYNYLINIKRFFLISLIVELVMMILVICFLLFPYNYKTALIIYLGYQFTFMFGSYLVRAETLFFSKAKSLSKIDIYKQSGYLIGLLGGFIFYKLLDFIKIVDKNHQIYDLHYIFLIIEIIIIFYLIKAFKIFKMVQSS